MEINKSKYPPLELLAMSDQPNREFISRKQQFMSCGCKNMDKMTSDEYIKFFLSNDFYNPYSNHKFKDISRLLRMNEAEILNKEHDESQDPVTEWKDIYLAPVLIEEWSRSKQVYKPDADFADALLNTAKLELSISMIEHLPCKSFYLDVSDCEQFGSVVGVFTFVKLDKTNGIVDIILYLLTKELVYFSFYTGGYFDDKGLVKLDLSTLKDKDYVIWNPAFIQHRVLNINREDLKMSRKSVYIFALQMICYLSIDEPQIDESELTKNTYKPRTNQSKVRNKWSEVHIQDVGVRYGKSFRKQMKQYIEDTAENNEENGSPEVKLKRKSPVPHFRCAHWHKYWTGEGRKICKVNWVEPVFVGNKQTGDVVIHTVRKEE